MKRNADQAVERVLEGIRDSVTPEGMEQRILVAMQQRQDVVPARRWGWIWVSAGAAALAVLLVLVLPRRTHRDVAAARPAIVSQPQQQGVSVPHVAASVLQSASAKQVVAHQFEVQQPVDQAPVLSAMDELAMEEMLAPSMPAPEMPLTEQERMLRRVARQRNPEEFPALNPDERDAQYEAAKAEVHDFFEPPVVNESE